MKKSFFILLVPLMLVLHGSSCSKPTRNEWQTVVNGKAVEYNTTVPVTNARVQLFAGTRTQAEAVTDVNGAFHFDFIANPGTVYSVLVTPDTMNPKKKYFQTRIWNIAEGQIHNLIYPVTPYAYVRIHVKNSSPVNEQDKLSITYPFLFPHYFYGHSVDTTIIDYCSGNEGVLLTYIIRKNGQEQVLKRNDFLPAHDTTFIEILY